MTDVTFDLPQREILGLIGPNGARKTTLFNCINGVYAPEEGQVIFQSQDITGWKPYRVAHLGLARTHQIVQPLDELTVLEAVDAARERGIAEPLLFGDADRIRQVGEENGFDHR